MKLTRKFVALFLVLALSLSLCSFAMAAVPEIAEKSTVVSGPSGITSFTVNGDAPSYQTDEGSSAVYARVIDNGGSEYALKHATIEIRADEEIVVNITDDSNQPVSISEYEDEESMTPIYVAEVDLFNKVANVTIGTSSYVVAAGLPDGAVAIDANDPLKINSIVIGNATGAVSATNVQNPYMGNDALSGGTWTFINYKVDAAMSNAPADRANVAASVSLASGASAAGCYDSGKMDLTAAAPIMTVSKSGASRNYYIFATDPNTITVEFGIDFTEAKASEYYTGSIKTAVDTLEEQAKAAFGGTGYGEIVVTSGMNVMDVMHNFALTYGYDDEVPANCTYISTLNGIGEFDFGYASGWMYTDGPSWDSTGAALFTSWNTPPVGAASYTLTEGDTICWFICEDYTHHPWEN